MPKDDKTYPISAIEKARTVTLQKTSDGLIRRAIRDIDRLITDPRVSELIANGPDVNASDKDGLTPLCKAAFKGQKDVAGLLIAKGANVNTGDKYGPTPLHYAVFGGSKDVAELLIAKGADVNAKGKDGKTPLHVAEQMAALAIPERCECE